MWPLSFSLSEWNEINGSSVNTSIACCLMKAVMSAMTLSWLRVGTFLIRAAIRKGRLRTDMAKSRPPRSALRYAVTLAGCGKPAVELVLVLLGIESQNAQRSVRRRHRPPVDPGRRPLKEPRRFRA